MCWLSLLLLKCRLCSLMTLLVTATRYHLYNLDMVAGKFKNCLLENFKICQDHHKRRKRSKRLNDCAFYHFNICVKD